MPKIVDHEQYRKELLIKCFDLFAQKGYASITMREIAKGLGVSTGTLYHYFPSKEALYLQLVEELTQRDILDFLAEAGDAKSLPERIKALFNFIAKNEDYFFKQTLLEFDFYQQQGRNEILNNQILRKNLEYTKQAITDYLQIKDKALSEFVMMFISGLLVVRMYEGEAISYAQHEELLVTMLTSYLHQPKASIKYD